MVFCMNGQQAKKLGYAVGIASTLAFIYFNGRLASEAVELERSRSAIGEFLGKRDELSRLLALDNLSSLVGEDGMQNVRSINNSMLLELKALSESPETARNAIDSYLNSLGRANDYLMWRGTAMQFGILAMIISFVGYHRQKKEESGKSRP